MTPQQGGPFALRVSVDNRGIDDAEDVRVEVFANSPLFGRRLVGRAAIDHIGPLSSGSVNVDLDTSQLVGSVVLEIVLDRLEKILEISDLNNTATLTLSFNPTDVDVGAGGFSLDYPAGGPNPTANTRSQIISGRGGVGIGNATWTGPGIKSSVAATAPIALSVAYADNAAMPLGALSTFLGQSVDTSTVLVRITRTGDANLDGIVNNDDVTIVGANYAPGFARPSWALGDFDYNGFVDNDDVTLLGAFFNPTPDPPPPPVLWEREYQTSEHVEAFHITGMKSAVPVLGVPVHSGRAVLTRVEETDTEDLISRLQSIRGDSHLRIDDDELMENLAQSITKQDYDESHRLDISSRSLGHRNHRLDSFWISWQG
jgi:hypothetical protein